MVFRARAATACATRTLPGDRLPELCRPANEEPAPLRAETAMPRTVDVIAWRRRLLIARVRIRIALTGSL